LVWENNTNRFNTVADIPSISIDYAVMERSKKIKKWCPLNFDWSDLGF
jgi:mannose-1-phosphate guanylyltransferase